MKKHRGRNTEIRQNRLKRRAIKGDPQGQFIILNGRIHQEHINIINTYAPNIGAPKYIKKILEDFKKDIDSNTIIAVSYTHLTLPTKLSGCRSRWSPYH